MQWFLPRLAVLSSYPLLSARQVPHWWALQGAGPAPGLVLWWLLVLFPRRPQVPVRELELELKLELKLEQGALKLPVRVLSGLLPPLFLVPLLQVFSRVPQ